MAAGPGATEIILDSPAVPTSSVTSSPGEPFFFKTHYPHNRLVGGGFVSGSVRLKVSEAQELFGKANGAASVEEMRVRIGRYRRALIIVGEDPVTAVCS